MKKLVLLILSFLFGLHLLHAETQLSERWSTALVFKVPESVLYDPDTRRIYVSNLNGGIDGLQPTGAGDYLISDWRGIVSLVSPDSGMILMDVTSQRVNTADFCYIAEENLLIVPTFGHNQLWSFELIRDDD